MTDHLSDTQLRAIQSDENLKESFIEQLIDDYSQGILWFTYTYVKDQQLAEEITQDVFLTCFQKIDQFKNQSSIKTWLYSITANRCKDQLRKKSLKSFLSLKREEQEKNRQDDKYPELILVEKLERENLANNVMALPAKFKEVIYMFYFEDMKINEISDILDVKQNTVKTRLNRGRNLLKKMYGGEE
ncbi:sigma-70 family RNA polymerase sigma factor [Thalassobacillus hwangdonensis]|uniref:Sigma-70 family RNA polymerase sigma factor n=1 Tax=Thalassobacillus hwangdonensis TaxID=546108 RepID=A0ABW3KWW2_9BACI